LKTPLWEIKNPACDGWIQHYRRNTSEMATEKKSRKSLAQSDPKPVRVLITDDHDIVRHGLKRLLTDHFDGVTFGEAKNAQEALDQCAAQEWSVVLLDITMPGRSGLDILADVKRICPAVPVLIMSAFPEEEFAMRALKSGAAGYIDKRTLAGEIVMAIKRVLTGECYVSAAWASKLAAHISSGETRPAHEVLSQREFQVLRLIAAGKSIKEIAADLTLSEKTVGTYRTRISEKLGLGTNVELTRYAMQHRLVE
jgi:two-component system, NarL family, invasion response regulator UvrY